jgi:hypothetical protein
MSMRCSTKGKTERRVSKLLNLHFLVPFLTVVVKLYFIVLQSVPMFVVRMHTHLFQLLAVTLITFYGQQSLQFIQCHTC